MVTIPDLTGPTTDRVRADLTYLPYPERRRGVRHGILLVVGSLSTNGYENDISRITGNVLRRFLD